jgi:hypothetical protein
MPCEPRQADFDEGALSAVLEPYTERHRGRHGEYQQKDRGLIREGIPGAFDPEIHVDTGTYCPQRQKDQRRPGYARGTCRAIPDGTAGNQQREAYGYDFQSVHARKTQADSALSRIRWLPVTRL